MTKHAWLATSTLLAAMLIQSACAAMPAPAPRELANSAALPAPTVRELANSAPKRVLFVGNSYFYYNDSLHNHVRRIVAEIGPGNADEYQYKSATIGGASLSHHNLDSLLEPGRLGIDKPFELVILQGGSGEPLSAARRAAFAAKAEELVAKIRAHGAEPALYMTHAYGKTHQKYAPDMIDTVAETYITTGNRLRALVIPVGLAFAKAYQRRPSIELHKTFDGSHPSMLGTYLAACVVYATVYRKPVTGINYNYFGEVSQQDAAFLQGIADETVQEFFRREN
jgi:hypothetical protein